MKTAMLIAVLGFCAALCFVESSHEEEREAAVYLTDLVSKAESAIKRGIPCRCDKNSDELNGEQSYMNGNCGDGWKKCRSVNAIFNCCQRV
uniref:Delta-aiptatoxin-Adi1a n=1 Tax=Exaiptasia diaphana TaxID=2652724 RepID=NAU1A_EXADI|nr:RecName: Full=Delta-aiptatoxin-Adi1a; Short=Delta-ATTX-Adi1a; AltName: Full=Ion channel modifier Ade-1; Short=Ade1; Flags: Precursor [Exaiptasia diaphana]ACQ83467.1 ion channel modifier [Exaiptasia diaphana]